MRIYPAIDLFGGKAVRLYKDDYNQMTVYIENPVETALDFKRQGAGCVHLVDLDGARSGETPNLETVCRIKAETQLFCEVGGVRSMDVVARYAEAGLDRVILGTAAVNDPDFLRSAVHAYGDKIAVSVDIRDGCVAVKGWTEKTCVDAFCFCEKMQDMGVETLICTDISRDGPCRAPTCRSIRRWANGLQCVSSLPAARAASRILFACSKPCPGWTRGLLPPFSTSERYGSTI